MENDPLYWLKNLIITAREGDDDEGDDQNDAGDNGDDNGEEGEGQEETSGSSDDEKSGDEDDEEDVAKLKAALKKERLLRREKERELRKAKRTRQSAPEESSEEESASDKEADKIRRKLESEQQRTRRLAEGFRKKSIDDAILTEARKQGFIDPTDALTDDIRSDVDYEQDRDDPTLVDIDMDSVEDAVKDLADRKKHLVGKGSPGTPSGGKFRRKQGSGDDDKGNEATLKNRYPSLN